MIKVKLLVLFDLANFEIRTHFGAKFDGQLGFGVLLLLLAKTFDAELEYVKFGLFKREHVLVLFVAAWSRLVLLFAAIFRPFGGSGTLLHL